MAAEPGIPGRRTCPEARPTALGPLSPSQGMQDPKILMHSDLSRENLKVAGEVWVLKNEMDRKGPRLWPWAEREDQRC